MVLLDYMTMSRKGTSYQGPSPPTVEQILEDLKAASEDDIVFQPPAMADDEEASAKPNIKNPGLTKEECPVQHSSSGKENRDISEKMGTDAATSQSNEQLYGKVTSFLDQYQSLVSSHGKLKSFEGDLMSKKQGLEEAIDKVKEAWKVNKENS